MRPPLFVANWKMNKFLSETAAYVPKLADNLADVKKKMGSEYEVVLAPPATHLTTLIKAVENTKLRVGAQNCGTAKSGAFTGEISPAVLNEIGCPWVILGHSERRHVYKEDNALVQARLKAAVEEGLNVIFCVGELLQERKAGKTTSVIADQLGILTKNQIPPFAFSRIVVAYEPVWAIGTGENATPEQAEEVHLFIRNWFSEKFTRSEADALRILYGGSVKPENSGDIMAQKDVDGLLVGGASLDPVSFAKVIKNGLVKSGP